MKGLFVNFARSIILSLEDVSKNIIKSLISSFGIFFLIAFLVLYVSVRASVKNYVDKNIFGTLSIDEIRITPKNSDKFDAFANNAAAGTINSGVMNAIKKMPEIKKTYSLMQMDHQAFLIGDLSGKKQTVPIAFGSIENDFFRDRNPKWRDMYVKKDLVPVVGPNLLIDFLNSYLTSRGLPAMPAASLKGFPVELKILGTERGVEPKKEYIYNAEIHDITGDLPFSGVVVPKEFVARFLAEHGSDSNRKLGVRCKLMYLKVNDIKALPETTAKLKKMGVNVESQQDVASKTNKALTIIDGSSLLIIGMFLIITVISIFNSYLTIVYNRSQKFSLRRVLGVPKYQIIMGFVIEAALVGTLYGIVGYFAGNALLSTFADYVGKFVPSLKGIIVQSGESKALLATAIIASAAISSLSALIPAIFAANMNLFKAIRK